MGKTIFIGTRKGGVGKTMTAASLGFGLARQGKKVLLIDADSQHSLTLSLGFIEPDELTETLSSVIHNIINERDFDITHGIVSHDEGVDLLPANNSLTGVELLLAPLIGRESVLKQYVEMVKPFYDYIIIDTAPTLDLLTINALTAADSVIIPVTPKYLDAIGMELLLKSIAQIKGKINQNLKVDGILLTMVDRRSNLTRDVIESIENAYGGKIRIYTEYVPRSVKAAETSSKGISIFKHDPYGKISKAYQSLVKEVVCHG